MPERFSLHMRIMMNHIIYASPFIFHHIMLISKLCFFYLDADGKSSFDVRKLKSFWEGGDEELENITAQSTKKSNTNAIHFSEFSTATTQKRQQVKS